MALTSRRRAPVAVVLGLVALVLALVAVSAGPGRAAGLTKGKVKKIATAVATKVFDTELTKRAPGLTVGDSAKLGGVPASAYVRTGTYQIAIPPSAWFPTTVTGQVIRNVNGTQVMTPNVAAYAFVLNFTAPSAAEGRRLQLTKVRYCFNAAGNIQLDEETLGAYRYTNGQGAAVGTQVHNTELNISTSGCRVIPAAIVLASQDTVSLVIKLDATGGTSTFLGGVTAQFEPTTQPVDPIS